jgi:hypothetical protein
MIFLDAIASQYVMNVTLGIFLDLGA